MRWDTQPQGAAHLRGRREAYLRQRSIGVEPQTASFEPMRSGRLALHPLLGIVPGVALLFAVAFDILYLITGSGVWAIWATGLIAVGLLGGAGAAAIGVLDWRRLPSGTQAKQLATWHGATSLAALMLLTVGWLLRLGAAVEPGLGSIMLVWSGVAVLILGGVLGGELTSRLNMRPDLDTSEIDKHAVAMISNVEPMTDERKAARA